VGHLPHLPHLPGLAGLHLVGPGVVHLGGERRVGRGGGDVSLVRDVRAGHVGHLPAQVRGWVDMSVVLM